MNGTLLKFGMVSAASYFVARVLAEALGLDALARDLGRWFRAIVPWLTYGGDSNV